MMRLSCLFAAIALTASPVSAATYSARPTVAVPGKFLGPDILWVCGTDRCVGSTEYSRPLILCEGLAKQIGAIDTFAVDGRELQAAEIDRCNRAARNAGTHAGGGVRSRR